MASKKKETPHLKFLNAKYKLMKEGEVKPEDLSYCLEYVIEYEAEIKAELNQFTMKQLKGFATYGSSKKPEYVNDAYRIYLKRWKIKDAGGPISIFAMAKEDELEHLRKAVAETTQEDIDKYALLRKEAEEEAKARKAKQMESLNNPQTIYDFELCIDVKKPLTNEQWAKYDALRWQKTREKETKEKVVYLDSFDIVDVDINLQKTVHTQKGHDLYVVTFTDWLDHEDWDSCYDKAKELGGYYSSYKENGAIPGIQFRSEVQARSFMNLLLGPGDTEEVLEYRRRLRQMNAAERLTTMAHHQIQRAQEKRNADRKTNTSRRVNIANIIEEDCLKSIAQAETMQLIAENLDGSVHPLDCVFHRTQLALLTMLSRWWDGNKLDVMPKISFMGCDIPSTIEKLETKEYTVHVCQFLKKHIYKKEIVFETWKEMEYAVRIFQKLGKDTPWYLAEALRKQKALARLGIQHNYQLRHTLRCLRAILVTAKKPDPILLAERELVGRKIPGFFPTPEALVNHLIDLADLQEGDVVLEPSAGIGYIAEAVQKEGVETYCVEINSALVEILKMKKLEVVQADFMTFEVPWSCNKILMNPPFENKQDLAHIQKAYELLPSGGRLVAIASSTITRYGETWLEEVSAEVSHNPEGSFKSAFRATGVSTVTLLIEK